MCKGCFLGLSSAPGSIKCSHSMTLPEAHSLDDDDVATTPTAKVTKPVPTPAPTMPTTPSPTLAPTAPHCPPGQFAHFDFSGSSGTVFQSMAFKMICTDCPVGKFQQVGKGSRTLYSHTPLYSHAPLRPSPILSQQAPAQSRCDLCPTGHFQHHKGKSFCDDPDSPAPTVCPTVYPTATPTVHPTAQPSFPPTPMCTAGHYWKPWAKICLSCPAGYYGVGVGPCALCAAGRYSSGGSSTAACTGVCPRGRYGKAGATTKRCSGVCQAGQYAGVDSQYGSVSPLCAVMIHSCCMLVHYTSLTLDIPLSHDLSTALLCRVSARQGNSPGLGPLRASNALLGSTTGKTREVAE
jgi:hypothetical protein